MSSPASGLHLPSDLWVDQPDAYRTIDEARGRGELDEETEQRLRHFVDEGYMTFPLTESPERFDRLLEDIERAWRERPPEIAFAYDSPPKRMTDADPAEHRRPRYRLHDLHGWSEAALALYLDHEVFRHIELIYRRPAVAIQSLFFEFGSQQAMHRDPVVVPSTPPSHLMAAWIALEDITPECGPLQYVPRSHRLPYYEFEPGQFMFDSSRMGDEEATAGLAWDRERCEEAGLEPRPFLARRGEVLLWHHSLLHGGAAPRDETRTRKSFVVHFCTRGDYERRAITLEENGAPVIHETRRTIERNGCVGFASPLVP